MWLIEEDEEDSREDLVRSGSIVNTGSGPSQNGGGDGQIISFGAILLYLLYVALGAILQAHQLHAPQELFEYSAKSVSSDGAFHYQDTLLLHRCVAAACFMYLCHRLEQQFADLPLIFSSQGDSLDVAKHPFESRHNSFCCRWID